MALVKRLLKALSLGGSKPGRDGVSIPISPHDSPLWGSAKPGMAALNSLASSPEASTQDDSYLSPAPQTRSRFVSSLDAETAATPLLLESAAASLISAAIETSLVPAPSVPSDPYDERQFFSSASSKSLTIFAPPQDVVPTRDAVQQFFLNACKRAQFQVAAVVSVVALFERVAKLVPIHSFNWRVVLLLSILISQKVIDDVALGTNQMPELFRAACKGSASTFMLQTRNVIQMELSLLATCKYDVAIGSDTWDLVYGRLQAMLKG